jgi:APA family basic amino acid/polyamine antiporter
VTESSRARASTTPAPREPRTLVRTLNAWDATLITMGAVIGGGIFLTPGDIAKSLPSPPWILFAWVVGGLLTLAGSLVYAELGAMFPETGGTYLYLREAYGALAGFLYAWMYFFVYNAGGIAALATGFAKYLAVFVPSLGMSRVVFDGLGLHVSAGQLTAVASVFVLTGTHYVGIREGARVQSFFTVLIVATMLGLVVFGAFASVPPAAARAPVPQAPITIPAFGLALVAVLWTYDGWVAVSAVAGEVKRPQRNLPLALVLGMGLVTLLYVSVNAIYLKAIPVAELAGVDRAAEVASRRLFGAGAALVVAAAVLASGFGCTSANIAPGPRVVWALANDRLFPRAFARVHPRFGTPAFGLVVQALWTALLCLSGRYEQLYTYSVFLGVLGTMAAAISLFLFRRKRPDAPRPYRCWGYPLVPTFYVLAALLFVANTLWTQPKESLAGLLILALGVPVYFAMLRRRTRDDAATPAG